MKIGQVWQIGSGKGRKLFELYAKYGKAFIGPGHTGDLTEKEYEYLLKFIEEEGDSCSGLYDFANYVKEGDIIVSRGGRFRIAYIGVVINAYKYDPLFSHIDGWDLSHTIENVDWWKVKDSNSIIGDRVFNISRFSRSNILKDFVAKVSDDTIDSLNRYLNSDPNFEKVVPVSYHPPKSVALEDRYHLDQRMQEISIWQSTNHNGEESRKVLLVVPFLQRLGWSPLQMTFERQNIDILLYKDTEHRHPYIVVEVKSSGSGLEMDAMDQGKNYLQYLDEEERSEVGYVITTDGTRYVVSGEISDEHGFFDRASGIRSEVNFVEKILPPVR